jgi:CRP/FNR family transcriptional regulator
MKNSDHRIPSTCNECLEHPKGFFCGLSRSSLAELLPLRITHKYKRGAVIFMEGQPSGGVHILCSGRAKLSTYSEDGRAIILRIADAGETLGLGSVIAGGAYEKTAQALEECLVSFIAKKDFLEFVQKHHDAALNALRQLSSNYRKAHLQICSLGLSSSAGDKLARLLLQWCDTRPANGGPIYIARAHTHVDIAEMIGSSRETVTRLLNDFKERGLVRFSKTDLCIPDRGRLKAAIGLKHRNGNGQV